MTETKKIIRTECGECSSEVNEEGRCPSCEPTEEEIVKETLAWATCRLEEVLNSPDCNLNEDLRDDIQDVIGELDKLR